MSETRRDSGIRRALPWAAVAVVAFVAGLLLRAPAPDSGRRDGPGAEAPAAAWTCSMHPQIQLPGPGQCPVCFMDLIPAGGVDDPAGPRTLELTETAAALAEIATAPVARRFAERELRLVGRVAVDEARVRTVTARFPGRIDSFFVTDTGARVSPGQPLVSVFSPALYAAQVELRSALASARAGDPAAAANLEAVRRRLRLWGLDADQVAALEAAPAPRENLTLGAPAGGVVLERPVQEGDYVETGARLLVLAALDSVRVELQAYETDLPWLRVGQEARFAVTAQPGRDFAGEIVFIDPVLDARTRTAGVRVMAANPEGLLRPGFFVRAEVASVLGADGRPVSGTDEGEPPLVVPATAPLLTGTRAVVYVRDPDSPEPRFEGREVALGPRAGDHYLVASGLEEGELVVVNGAFKIDSALQIRARPSMMGRGDEAPPVHHHDPAGSAPVPAGPFDAPASFRAGLASLVAGYLDLQAALAADDFAAAGAGARAALQALESVPARALAPDAAAAWDDDRRHLEGALAATAGAADIAAQRRPLAALSDRLWDALNRFGHAGDAQLRRFHCPMAGEGGANWLQTAAETANPYYGDAMLRCGRQTEILPGLGAGEGGP